MNRNSEMRRGGGKPQRPESDEIVENSEVFISIFFKETRLNIFVESYNLSRNFGFVARGSA